MPGGAPVGNKNAAKSRLFEQAFLREIKARDLDAGDGETLRKIAAKILDQALNGDIPSFREARDTTDGKPAQAVELAGDPDRPVVHRIERIVVKADA